MPHIVYSQATGPPNFEWDDEPAVDDLAPDGAGCRCTEGNCVQRGCPCRSAACRFDSLGRPVVQGGSVDALNACGPRCSCAGACSSKAAQWRLAMRRGSGKRGWAVYAAEPLPEGALIGLYSGEFLSTPEAVKRLKEYDLSGGGHALLVLREWLPSRTAAVRINIDATRRGNAARFYNHSCDGGNLRLLLTRRTGCLLPRVSLVTSAPVREGEELCWSYGAPNPGPDGKPCFCGTSACLGFMPHEDV